MSKNYGSISPSTVRLRREIPVTGDKGLVDILEYDSQFQTQYTHRNKARLEILKKQALNIKTLGELEKYCDGDKFKDLKSKFSEIAGATSEIRNIEQIRPYQIADSLRFMTVFQPRKEGIADLPLDPLKPIVVHYGINAVNSVVFIGHVIEEKKLHPIECSVFKDAIKYLGRGKCHSAQEYVDMRTGDGGAPLAGQPLPPPSAEQSKLLPPPLMPKPNNVVLVSFFPRKPDDKLLKAKTIVADDKFPKEAETHTIVLWKTEPDKITIIDPTDKNFSKFLVEILNGTGTVKPFEPYTFCIEECKSVKGKIYTPKSGPRDCTDIAVKIAFELNEKQADHSISSANDILTVVIRQISNAGLTQELGSFIALQSSDINVRYAAKKLIDDARSVGEKIKNLERG